MTDHKKQNKYGFTFNVIKKLRRHNNYWLHE